MSFQVCGDNRQANIESQVTFTDGDTLLCDPGVDFCSSRAFDLMQLTGPINTTGYLKNIFNVDKIPDFGSNQYGFTRCSGLKYYIHEDTQFAYNESFTITHAPDPDYKRYCEAWVTYYPTTNYQPQLLTGDDILVTSSGVSMKPLLAPDVMQSISFPAAASSYYATLMTSTLYERIKLDANGDQFIIWAGPWIIIYEWNGSSYSETYSYEFADAVQGAYVHGDEACVVTAGLKLYWLAKSGTWSIDETINPWTGGVAGPPHKIGTGFYIFSRSVIWYQFDHDGNQIDYADNPDWDVWPASRWQYVSTSKSGIGWDNAAWSILGGSPNWRYTHGIAGGEEPDADYPCTVPDEDDHCYFSTRASFLYFREVADYDGNYINFTWMSYIYHMYGYMYQAYTVLDLDAPTSTQNGYIFNKYLVGWRYPNQTAGIFYFHTTTEYYRLYDYDVSVHKLNYIYPFYPIKAPDIYAVNGGDGTLKILKMKAAHYDDLSPKVGTFTVISPTEITTTTDYTIPSQPSGCSFKFLISHDNVNWYKWGGSSWVSESNILNGNDYTTFKAGCQSGYVPPAYTYTLYIKMAFYSTVDADSPGWSHGECYMGLTTISSSNNAYLCDDSKIKIEHLSSTTTKFTSLMNQNVIISAQVNILAPPYNVDYED